MPPITNLTHRFIEYVPDEVENGVLYISIPFATATHRCCCGCGEEVVTPLTPNDWSLIFDGETVSLMPSIGNWSFACKSHYWIKRNQVIWAPAWSESQIVAGRARDAVVKQQHFELSADLTVVEAGADPVESRTSGGILRRLSRWLTVRRSDKP